MEKYDYDELIQEAEELFKQIRTNCPDYSTETNHFIDCYVENEDSNVTTGFTYNTL